jgi:hypothetical protein
MGIAMSSPDGIERYECPICKRLTPADELLDCSGLCFRCDHEQQEVMADNKTEETEEREEEDAKIRNN